MGWLKELCGNGSGQICKQPWSLLWRDRIWIAATDGRILVVVREPSEFDPPSQAHQNAFRGLLDAPTLAEIGQWDASLIKSWAGECAVKVETCETCNGTGDHTCGHEDCGDVHDCGACDGTGKVEETPNPRPGRIGSVLVDRNLFVLPFAHLTGAVRAEAIQANARAIRLRGPDWFVIVMGASDLIETNFGPAVELFAASVSEGA